ncbi:hypothetical protein P7K49_026075 [Saguinus oedipus]|uniref:Uncharacterized protein n=1 Tax=Saguinus oedipus TaxID=9490 RepID=A0ABQ9UJI8_SAGOE|nr:hypothetical protein P7K49_026075 [Saguinus oedipus]
MAGATATAGAVFAEERASGKAIACQTKEDPEDDRHFQMSHGDHLKDVNKEEEPPTLASSGASTGQALAAWLSLLSQAQAPQARISLTLSSVSPASFYPPLLRWGLISVTADTWGSPRLWLVLAVGPL